MKIKGKILVVDDNQGIRSALKILLSIHFEQVRLISSPKTLVNEMETYAPDVILLDMNFTTDINTGNEGLFWTSEIKKMYPLTEIVLFTAYADIALAVEGMKRGAFDFVVKPWDNDKLVEVLSKALNSSILKKRKNGSAAGSGSSDTAGSTGGGNSADGSALGGGSGIFWGTTEKMLRIRETVSKVAGTDATVLITGENGTGKDVLAKEIHAQSARRAKPMVCVDAGAITETLFESELFGHVKGAFTDAHCDHMGKFEQADGGTLFLDEIGNIPLHLQAKLLRVLQNRCVTRVGSEKHIPVDIRLICATNMDLDQMVREGRFRQDLYYRINTVHLHIPALRERSDDILPLAGIFLNQYAGKYGRTVSHISDKAAQLLVSQRWEGNVRELQNTMEKAVILSEGEVLMPADMMLESSQWSAGKARKTEAMTLEETEEEAIRGAMMRCNGNLSMVAKELGVSRPTLYSKLKKYGI